MSLDNFIPTIWAARIMKGLQKSLVYGQSNVVNRDYEGEIRKAGDTVKINSIGDVTINDYVKNVDIAGPEILDSAQQTLRIDQQKYFNLFVDDIDKAQGNPAVMDTAMQQAGFNLKDRVDQFIAGHHVHVPAANLVGSDGSPISLTNANADDAYEQLVDLGVKLDEANVPAEGRFAIIPPWMHGLMQKDARFVQYGGTKQEQVLRNGIVGEAAGFTILKSNNVPNTGGTLYKIIGGNSMAFSFAEQILEVTAYKPEKRFGDAVKGLHVYGGKLVRPYCWAVLTANKS